MKRILAVLAFAFLVGCGSDQPGSSSSSQPDSLVPATVEFNGRTYICIRYTTQDRGGLWCERISQ
jgi:hypothetical protein